MKQSRYSEEVTRLLASLDGQQENTKPHPETPIPDTQEPIQDVYIRYIFLEPETDQDELVVDSTLTEAEPDTTIPHTPPIRPLTPKTQPLTRKQARDEKISQQVGL